jgi:signal transduction histidine kinase
LWDQFGYPALALGALALVLASSALVLGTGWPRRLPSGWPVVGDVGATLGAVVLVDLSIKASADPSVANAVYPYSAVAMAIVGFVPVRLRWALAGAGIATLVYVGVTSARFGFRTELLNNAVTYWAYAVASWVLARRFRQMGVWLESARRDAVDRERQLVEERSRAERERERAETCRVLHDNVLQTMESLSREEMFGDESVRGVLRRDAAWLRALIHNELDPHPPELVAALQAVVARHSADGLDITLNTATVGAHRVPVPVVEALARAVSEALTNVVKHAGVRQCVVRAETSAGEVYVTVVDQGRGFDDARVRPGIGVAQSVVARIGAVGGQARIISRPGNGTIVELRVPVAAAERASARSDGG